MFFPESFSEMPIYVLVWVGIAYLFGRWQMRVKLTWNRHLHFVFSDGYELATALDGTTHSYTVKTNAKLINVQLRNAVGKVIEFPFFSCDYQPIPYIVQKEKNGDHIVLTPFQDIGGNGKACKISCMYVSATNPELIQIELSPPMRKQ